MSICEMIRWYLLSIMGAGVYPPQNQSIVENIKIKNIITAFRHINLLLVFLFLFFVFVLFVLHTFGRLAFITLSNLLFAAVQELPHQQMHCYVLIMCVCIYNVIFVILFWQTGFTDFHAVRPSWKPGDFSIRMK